MNWGKNEKWREKISENKILFIFPSNAGRIHFERAFSASLFHDEKPPWNARETMRRMRKVSIVRSMFDMYDIFPDIQDFANKLWKNAKLSAENENGEKRGKKRNRHCEVCSGDKLVFQLRNDTATCYILEMAVW